MSNGRLKPEDEKCVQQNYKYLKEHLEALDIVDYLYQHQVITLEDKEKIYKVHLKARTEQNEILLSTLLKAGPGEAFNYFLKSLEPRHQPILEHIKQSVKQKKEEELLLQEENKILKSELINQKKEDELLKEEIKSLNVELGTSEHLEVSKLNMDLPRYLTSNYLTQNGKHETDMVLNEENDISKLYAECKKNPGHVDFIPFETFNINDLPKHYRIKNVYKHTQALAELTVKIDVSVTSLDRPEFVPGTTIPYPFSDIRGSTIQRSGSGFVYGISKIDNNRYGYISLRDCSCNKCIQSDQPSTKYWRIDVVTARQVVYDRTEALKSSVRLFYDMPDSPLVLLSDCINFSFNSMDRSLLRFMTCNAEICNKLEKKH